MIITLLVIQIWILDIHITKCFIIFYIITIIRVQSGRWLASKSRPPGVADRFPPLKQWNQIFSGREVISVCRCSPTQAHHCVHLLSSLLTPAITSTDFLLIVSHSRDVQPKVVSSSLGHLSVAGCQLHCAPAENRACQEAAVHFWATFPGRSRGQPWVNLLFSPFLLHFGRSAKGWFSLLESLADTFAQLGAGVLHNSPWCRHRLLRPALRYTSLHAQHCTIPPTHSFTSQLLNTAAAGKQNTPFHHISLPRRGTWTPAETRR